MGKRLREARDAVGLTQEDVAKAVGASKQLVSHWETGRSEITIFDFCTVSKLCGVTMDELIGDTGRGRSHIEQLPDEAAVIAFASTAECLAIARNKLSISDMQHKRVTHAKVSEGALALNVPETAMEPTFSTRMLITVDPKAQPKPGDCVLVALLSTDELLFRRYVPKIERNDAVRPPFTLRADNPYFSARDVQSADKPVYLGKLVETVSLGSG